VQKQLKPSNKKASTNKDIQTYNNTQSKTNKAICDRHPVWFLEGNPITGYSKLKDGIRLMFWSGASFDEEKLKPGTGKFKDASITYTSVEEINTKDLKRWLKKSKTIQWDYKNIVKRKGVLERLM
jgi:hypothetical protein